MQMHADLQSDAIKEALAVEVPKLLKEHHVAGASIALISDRTITLTMGYGLRNAVTGNPITPQSIFEAYSLTKPLIAYCALNLSQNGVLDLDRPLNDYLTTPYIDNDPRAGRITTRTVLAHTSGLPDDETDRRIIFTPGAQWSYSTQGYFFLQQVIEHLTAARFDATMQRHILDPLGMASSSFVWEDRFEAVMVQGHTAHGIPQDDRQIRVADADSLLTSAADYATFVVACMWPAGGESIDQSARLMRHPNVRVADQLAWGLGWGIETTDDGAWLWHIGGGSGAPFQNVVCVSAAHGMGVVILTNSANGGTIFEPLVTRITGRSFGLFRFVRDYFYR